MPSTLFGMKLMSIHISVLGNSFFKLELDNLWDAKNFSKNLEKRDFTRIFFFGIRLVYGGGLRQSSRWLNNRVEPSIVATFWWKIGCFFYGVDGSTQKSEPCIFTPEYILLSVLSPFYSVSNIQLRPPWCQTRCLYRVHLSAALNS